MAFKSPAEEMRERRAQQQAMAQQDQARLSRGGMSDAQMDQANHAQMMAGMNDAQRTRYDQEQQASQAKRAEMMNKMYGLDTDGSAESLLKAYMDKFITGPEAKIMGCDNKDLPGSPCTKDYYAQGLGRGQDWTTQGMRDPALSHQGLEFMRDPQNDAMRKGLQNNIMGALAQQTGSSAFGPQGQGAASDFLNPTNHRLAFQRPGGAGGFDARKASAEDYMDRYGLSNLRNPYGMMR